MFLFLIVIRRDQFRIKNYTFVNFTGYICIWFFETFSELLHFLSEMSDLLHFLITYVLLNRIKDEQMKYFAIEKDK